ncbi:GyrI-like domain-containing protein [Dongia sp.]|uniref:AraC family transcriptional regulator n=1 Tax=Dongia sp. TaxID=1977262 RepID=UPI0035B4D5E2
MKPVDRALWYIESHFRDDISLDDIAKNGGVSRFHLSRAFSAATTHSVIGYLRGRRLTEAARRLADGAPDILDVAIEIGYGSHEAFTRAFRDFFGLTPEEVRQRGSLQDLSCLEPMRMDDIRTIALNEPRFAEMPARLFVGINDKFNSGNVAGIPALWQRFNAYWGAIPHMVPGAGYGICHTHDDSGNFDYVAGVEVTEFTDVPAELFRLRVPAQRYAIFAHEGHVSDIRSVCHTIWNKWLPASGFKAADTPVQERYHARFDPATGLGGFEIWLPIKE